MAFKRATEYFYLSPLLTVTTIKTFLLSSEFPVLQQKCDKNVAAPDRSRYNSTNYDTRPWPWAMDLHKMFPSKLVTLSYLDILLGELHQDEK